MKPSRLLPLLVACSPFFSIGLHAEEPAKAPVNPAYVWDLGLIYKDEAAYKDAKAKLSASLPKLATFKGHLGDSPAKLLEAMDAIYDAYKLNIRLNSYASQKLDENLSDSPAMERSQEIDMVGTELSQAISYMSPELIAIGEKKIREFIAAEPKLKPYTFPLMETLRMAPHTLGAEAEQVMSSTSMISDAPQALYGILSSADIQWPTIKLSDGTDARLSQAGYTKYRAINNRQDREAVFKAFWGKFKEYERTFGVSLFSSIKGDWFRASVRKHPSSLAATLSNGNVPESVYRTLVAETNANLPTLHRYFKLRGRMLGIPELRYWDIYPPIVKLEKDFPYEDAKKLLIDSAAPLGTEYVKTLTESLNGRYTHVYPQPGKRSGAYMNGSVYDVHPFVLTNYNNNYDAVTTLAHEWGHGGHSSLTNKHQPFATSDYSIFVAEIASTLNEALLLDHMLKIAKSDEERMYYLGSALEGLRGTFFRQAMFAEFELRTHEEVEKGGALSGSKLTQIYGDILRRYHGHDQGVMKIDDLVTVEWAYIPHFYRNFYVYQYATSISASQAFAEKILKGEKGAVETYLELLKAGGSDHPYELVKRAGVDLATPAPYRALVTRMNSIMDEIEKLLAKQGK